MTDSKLNLLRLDQCRDAAEGISAASSLLLDVLTDFEGSDQWPDHFTSGRVLGVLALIQAASDRQYGHLAQIIGGVHGQG